MRPLQFRVVFNKWTTNFLLGHQVPDKIVTSYNQENLDKNPGTWNTHQFLMSVSFDAVNGKN